MGDVKPQDQESGLVARTWQRIVGRNGKPGKRGETTEETLEGQQVEAEWLDPQGHAQHATGTVVRNDAGELAIESWADGVRRQSTVTRDANLTVTGKTR